MEYLEIGDLFTYLYQNPLLPETEAKHITYQILDALTMIHEHESAHRDLKPNVSFSSLSRDVGSSPMEMRAITKTRRI
jgi:serine/threonine protein kinase